jgi:hypothetical protein
MLKRPLKREGCGRFNGSFGNCAQNVLKKRFQNTNYEFKIEMVDIAKIKN